MHYQQGEQQALFFFSHNEINNKLIKLRASNTLSEIDDNFLQNLSVLISKV